MRTAYVFLAGRRWNARAIHSATVSAATLRSVATLLPPQTKFTVIDPFAGSCNTLYWILRHVPRSTGIAFELDPQVHELTTRNIAELDREITLTHGDYESL